MLAQNAAMHRWITRFLPAELSQAIASSILGGALMAAVGARFRIDLPRGPERIPLGPALIWAMLFLTAVALLVAGWLGAMRALSRNSISRPPSTGLLLFLFLLPHLVILRSPPCLSDDPLVYAAIGRAITLYGASGYAPLGASIPVGDPVRALIERYPSWLAAGSAYGPLWNAIAALVTRLAPDALLVQLRLYQMLSLISISMTAHLLAAAARRCNPEAPGAVPDAFQDPERAAQSMLALVLLCPLTIVEGTLSAHNDALLGLACAGCIWFTLKGRPRFAVAALFIGTLVKVSCGLLLALYLTQLALQRRSPPQPRPAWHFMAAAAALTALSTGIPMLFHGTLWRYASKVAMLLGRPDDLLPACTRSLECFPRAIAHFFLEMPALSWAIGLVFRAAALILFMGSAFRAGKGVAQLRTASAFLLLYYLLVHPANHTWYGLLLVPLIPFTEGRLKKVLIVFLATGLVHYAAEVPWSGAKEPMVVGLRELFEGIVTIGPALVLLIFGSPSRRN